MMHPVENDAWRLTDDERMALAHAVYAHANYIPPTGPLDLSSVKNPVERAVEDILAARRDFPPATPDQERGSARAERMGP